MPIIVVAPGIDTSIPTGVQFSATFELTGPDGSRAVFNDQNDRDFVGMLRNVTGLDSPEVRENAEDLVQMDGGVHGDFFYGRRPIVLEGLILNPASIDERNRRQTRLMRASNAMRGDATLSWTLDYGHRQYVKVRRQQPLRINGAWQKDFQLALVAADPRIYNSQLRALTVAAGGVAGSTGFDSPLESPFLSQPATVGSLTLENDGSTDTPPYFIIYGPVTNPTITNTTTGDSIVINYQLAVGDYMAIDTLNRTVILNNNQSRYGAVDFNATTWFWLRPGENTIEFAPTAYQTGAALRAEWRDAWL